MIQKFIDKFMENKHVLQKKFSKKHPDDYIDIVRAVVEILHDDYGTPDPERIHEINDGEYQGTLTYIIAEDVYQPFKYWYVKVCYGSCSGCDTLQNIRDYSDVLPTEQQVKDYIQLALNIVQDIKEMKED